MKKIKLTRGRETLVDDDDFQKFYKYLGLSWCCSSHGYATASKMENRVTTNFYLHRLVVGAKRGEMVDHINHDKLDNRKENLRLCTPAQNNWNRKVKKSKRTGYIGVWKDYGKRYGFSAMITVNGKRTYLGRFNTKEKAALAYNEAAVRLKGEFAVLNVVP